LDTHCCSAALAAVERRLADLEAHDQVLAAIARYSTSVDAGEADATAEVFSENGSYSFTLGAGTATLEGRDDVRDMVLGDMHQGIILGGAGHVMGLPLVEVDGNVATATGHSMLVRFDAGVVGFHVARLSANRWELTRTAAGWQVDRRVNQLLDGRDSARALMGRPGVAPAETVGGR
jgi:SnoaL-like domain